MVARRPAHVFEVIVLAGDTKTLLASCRPGVRPLLQSQERILELHHAGVHEQQRRVSHGDQRRTCCPGMPLLLKELEIGLSNLGCLHSNSLEILFRRLRQDKSIERCFLQ